MSEEMFSGTKSIDDRLKFNLEGLKTYFSENLKEFGNINSVVQFKGGQSNPTYKVSTQKKEFVLRRKPPGKLLPSAHAVDREFRVISALENTDVPVPKTFGLCNDREVIGTEFYIMEYLDGAIYWDLLLEKLEPEDRRKIYANKNKVISALHMVNCDDVGLSDYGKSGDYVARQVSRWTKQYIASETVKLMLKKRVDLRDSNVLILGFTFKEECPDFRNTKVIDVILELSLFGLNIMTVDPWVDRNKVFDKYGIKIFKEIPKGIKFDAAILAVAHSCFKKIEFKKQVNDSMQTIIFLITFSLAN